MKAISISQPWAWLIIRPDLIGEDVRAAAAARGEIKDIENRNWRYSLRGPILIHAALAMTQAEYENALDFVAESFPGLRIPEPKELAKGGIIGRAEITDCVSDDPSRWFVGRFGYKLAKARPLPFRPMRGALGFFDVPDMAVHS